MALSQTAQCEKAGSLTTTPIPWQEDGVGKEQLQNRRMLSVSAGCAAGTARARGQRTGLLSPDLLACLTGVMVSAHHRLFSQLHGNDAYYVRAQV